MITIRRIKTDLFDMVFENGGTRVEETIGIDELLALFQTVTDALTDDASRTNNELRDARNRLCDMERAAA